MLQCLCRLILSLFMLYRKLLFLFIFIIQIPVVVSAEGPSELLSPSENIWFEDRSRTIIVQPEKNYPPFSYTLKSQKNSFPQGYSIDFIELVAEKIGGTIEYKEARSFDQIMEEVRLGNTAVLVSITETEERLKYFNFTDPYVSVPAVFVVRKDSSFTGSNLSPVDFSGKRVAVGSEYAVEGYLKQNYPRIVLEGVTDDEVALQKVLLNDVDAAVIDIASLSHFTSRSVLSSVRIAGTTGFSYELAFAVPKDNKELLSIIQKGLLAISEPEREILRSKWINFQEQVINEASSKTFWDKEGYYIPITVAIAGVIIIVIFAIRPRRHTFFDHIKSGVSRKQEAMQKLEKLEEASQVLEAELKEIKQIENTIAETINNLEK